MLKNLYKIQAKMKYYTILNNFIVFYFMSMPIIQKLSAQKRTDKSQRVCDH